MQGRIEDIEVSDDHIILSDICEEHAISPKWLASATGRSLSQVYRYLSGESTIPSIAWRVLYGRTRDLRIVQLVTGDVPVTVVDLLGDEPTVFERLDAPSLKQIVHHRRQQIACEEALLDILADGTITRRDAKAVSAYKNSHPKMIATAVRMYQAVMSEYERSGK
ncbi:MAG: hypothetical protein WC551_11105 [Patescibacteria group bacterium]